MTEFENENQPVCSSVSSCLTLNVSSILMSSLSSLINDIFIIVSSGSSVIFEQFVLFKKKIIKKTRNKCKLNLCVRLNQLSSYCTAKYSQTCIFRCMFLCLL